MEIQRLLLPIFLLFLQFFMKMFIGRPFSKEVLIQSLIDLPISMFFVGVSFATLFIVAFGDSDHFGLIWLLGYIIAAFLVVALARINLGFFDLKKKTVLMFFLMFINITMSTIGLAISTNRILGNKNGVALKNNNLNSQIDSTHKAKQ